MGFGRLFYPWCRTRVGHVTARLALRTVRGAGFAKRFHLPYEALTLDHCAVRHLCDLWSRIHWSAGDGMMPAPELFAVFRLAYEWPGDGDVVELGAWTGLTTCYLATACRARGAGHVHAVDTFDGTKEGATRYGSVDCYGGQTLDAFTDRVHRAGLRRGVTAHRGLTAEVATRYAGPSIRVLLIDADHSFAGVQLDFNAWLPHMAAGGLMIFHDYLMPDVARFVDGVINAHPGVAIRPGRVLPNVYAVTATGSRGVSIADYRSQIEDRPPSAPGMQATALGTSALRHADDQIPRTPLDAPSPPRQTGLVPERVTAR